MDHACVSAGIDCHTTAMSCASMLAQQQAQLPQATAGVAISSTDTFAVPCCTCTLLRAQGGAVFHTLVPPYTTPLHKWHNLLFSTAHADKRISMALPRTSHIASRLLVHGVIFSCRASTKTKRAGGLVHRQLCVEHPCRGTVMQHLGAML